MTTRRTSFKQADAARALKAAIAAGLQPSGYTIAPDGAITVSLGTSVVRNPDENTFDQMMGRGQ